MVKPSSPLSWPMLYILPDRVPDILDIKMSRVQNRIRTVMALPKAKIIGRGPILFAFSGLDAINTNIALWNAGCDAVKRRAKSCTNIFFTQILGHFKSPLRQPFSKTFCIRASHMRSRRLFLLTSISPAIAFVYVESAPYRRRLSACGVFFVVPAHFLP